MFKTLVTKKTPFITLGKILFILLMLNLIAVICSLITSAVPYFYRYSSLFTDISFKLNLSLVGLLAINAIHYVFFSRNKKIAFEGTLNLTKEAIILNEKSFTIENIKEIRIKGNDIEGDFRGYISKGTNNEILISLKNSEEKSAKFQQTKTNQLKSQKNILEYYQNKGILSTVNLYSILNNTNYY